MKMKDSGIEWIGQIPEDWSANRVKFHFSNSKDIVGIRVDNFERLALTLNGVIKRSKDDNEGLQPTDFVGYQILKSGELVFKLIDLQNVSTSRVGLSPYTGIVSPAYIVLSSNGDVMPEFAEKYFLSIWHREIFNALGDNGVRSNLNSTDLGNMGIVYPDLDTQKRIVAFLNNACSKIDAVSADIQEQIRVLEEYRKSVISEAVTKGLDKSVPMKDSGIDWIGEIPADWDLRKGKYIFKLRNQRGNNKNLELLSPTQNYGVIPQTLYEEYSGMVAVKLKADTDLNMLKTVHVGDYCISLRSFQGGFEYSLYEGVVSPAYQIFYPYIDIDDRYYKYMFKEKGFIGEMNSHTMSLRDGKNIAFSDFGNTYIPFPSKNIQTQIADYLDNVCSKIDDMIATKQEQLDVLTKYKQSIIYEYVTGKKEVV